MFQLQLNYPLWSPPWAAHHLVTPSQYGRIYFALGRRVHYKKWQTNQRFLVGFKLLEMNFETWSESCQNVKNSFPLQTPQKTWRKLFTTFWRMCTSPYWDISDFFQWTLPLDCGSSSSCLQRMLHRRCWPRARHWTPASRRHRRRARSGSGGPCFLGGQAGSTAGCRWGTAAPQIFCVLHHSQSQLRKW